jgi:hypothetical protein
MVAVENVNKQVGLLLGGLRWWGPTASERPGVACDKRVPSRGSAAGRAAGAAEEGRAAAARGSGAS